MSLTLTGGGLSVDLDDTEFDLFQLAEMLGVQGVELRKLGEAAYGSYAAGRERAEQLRSEVKAMCERYTEREARSRNIRARDPDVRQRLVAETLSHDPTWTFLSKVLAVCEAALEGDGVLFADGD